MPKTSNAGSYGAIQTERLDLLPMGIEFLEAYLNGDKARAASLLGHPVADEWLPNVWTVRRLEQMRIDPTLEAWLLRAVILRATGRMIGHISFHTAPDPDYLAPYAPGGVEFGYTIYPAFRQQGYATEMAAGLMAWAEQEHGVRRFVLSISPENLPSQRIAHHFHFRKIGSHIDEEDGLEEIFLLDLDQPDSQLPHS